MGILEIITMLLFALSGLLAFGAQHYKKCLQHTKQKKNEQKEVYEKRLQQLVYEKHQQEVAHEKNTQQLHSQIALLNQTTQHTEKHLKALCADALHHNSESFLRLAQTMIEKLTLHNKGHLSTHQSMLSELITPLARSLEGVDEKIHVLEKNRLKAYEGLYHHIQHMVEAHKELKDQTQSLATALRTPHGKGQWGEIQLKRIVEMAGMAAQCDFQEQASLKDDNQKIKRPDLVINLPGNRKIVVDAKAPLSSYLDATQATQDSVRHTKLKEHASHIRKHIKALSGKQYWQNLHLSPEFVLLFLPGEVFLSAALEQDPQLLEYSVEHQVLLATPTTLISLLRAISFGWRQETLCENAQEISRLGRVFCRRLQDVTSHFSHLGRQLDHATNAYNQTVGSLEGRLLPTARKLGELGGYEEKEAPAPLSSLCKKPRPLQAKEWEVTPPDVASLVHP